MYRYDQCDMFLSTNDSNYYFRMGQAMQKDSTDFLQSRYMPLAICPQEFAALTGILFWNTGPTNSSAHIRS
jgi:hypothetical protein